MPTFRFLLVRVRAYTSAHIHPGMMRANLVNRDLSLRICVRREPLIYYVRKMYIGEELNFAKGQRAQR
jgi:hypothetical protein